MITQVQTNGPLQPGGGSQLETALRDQLQVHDLNVRSPGYEPGGLPLPQPAMMESTGIEPRDGPLVAFAWAAALPLSYDSKN